MSLMVRGAAEFTDVVFMLAVDHQDARALRAVIDAAPLSEGALWHAKLHDLCLDALYDEGPNSAWFVQLVALLSKDVCSKCE